MNQRILSLTGLKILAVFGIFYWHSALPKVNIDLGARLTELFFVASGFLVAYNFSTKDTNYSLQSMFAYWKKKLFHFYPLHIVTFLIWLWLLESFHSIPVLFNLLLIQAWSLDKNIYFGYNSVSWFLSGLLFCYFFAPLLVHFLKQNSVKKNMLFLCGIFSFRIFIELMPLLTNSHLLEINYHFNPFVRFFEFAAGVFMFPVFKHINEKIDSNNVRGNVGVLLLTKNRILFTVWEIFYIATLYLIWEQTSFIRGFYVPLVGVLIVTLALELGYVSKLLSCKLLVNLGNIELEFYMLHLLILTIFTRYFPSSINIYLYNAMIFAIVILCSFICKKSYPKRSS